jgi:hypothetical protein
MAAKVLLWPIALLFEANGRLMAAKVYFWPTASLFEAYGGLATS